MRMGPEDILSSRVNQALKWWKNQGRINALCFHVPNEFVAKKNGAAAWAKKKLLGCVAGAPDWVILWKGGCACIELKAKGNKLSASQKAVQAICEQIGVPYAVCYSVEEVEEALQQAGALS